MRQADWRWAGLGVLALLGASCASMGGEKQAKESANPTTQAVAASQQRSNEALKTAQKAQQDATDAANKAASAQDKVRKDEQQLQQDQQAARQEQARAQQLQAQARQQTQQATQQAQQQQQVATQNLEQQTSQIAQGHQTASGVVTQVRPDEIAIQPQTGEAMKFRVGSNTQVRISGQQSSADQIREGSQARVSYEPSADGPRAVSVTVTPGMTGAGSQGSSSTGGSSMGSGSTGGTGSSSSGGSR